MAKKNYDRNYSDKKQSSIASALAANEEVVLTEPIEDVEDVAAEKKELSKIEVTDVTSIDIYIVAKALTDVNVRNTPEKIDGNINRVLRKEEKITLVTDYENPVWAKTKDGKYIMKEFLD